MHRNSWLKKSNKMQKYADIYLLLNYSTCFGRPSRPSSALHKTVVAASGTDHTVWGACFFKRDVTYDLYHRLQLAVNKYLHTVASCWIPSTYKETIFFLVVLYGCKNWYLILGRKGSQVVPEQGAVRRCVRKNELAAG